MNTESKISNSSWFTQPIFISSTFNDMQAERDWIRDVVMKNLEAELKMMKVSLEAVDLRWGVETKNEKLVEAKEQLVLKVCLNEIERCKPFLIVLIGDRFGWVPPSKRMKDAVNNKGLQIETEGMSVTELEIEYGIFENKEQEHRSFFYFREIENLDEMDLEVKAKYNDEYSLDVSIKKSHERLVALKKRIEEKYRDRTRTYQSKLQKDSDGKFRIKQLEEFGEMIVVDILKEIKKELEARSIKIDDSPEGKEKALLEEFVESKSKWFQGREVLLLALKEEALTKNNVGIICITSDTGCGKSSLFSKLYREFEHEAEIKKCLLLGHAAGISPASTSLESLFEKWISQLQKFLSVVPYKIQEEGDQTTIKERKNTFWEKQKLFSELLIQASHKTRVICLFDAINQMERTEIMKNMSWLPKILSSNSVLILTAIPGVETNSISKMANGRIQTLDKLNENDSREILIALYKKNHKTPNEDVMNIVLQREKGGIKSSSNPLWLNLAMEHLLVLDEDDFSDHNNLNGNTPEEKLHSLLMKTAMEFPSDLETLYFSLLERAKKNFGNRINAKWIQKMLNYIACSRFGLRRDDLRKLLNKNNEEDFEIKFVSTLNYFGAHIVERGPLRLLNFSHQQLKFWIDEDNNIEFDSSVYKKLHKDIAQHFKKLDRSDLLRQQEIVYHFLLAEEDKEISSYYGDSELTEFEIESASKILANSMTDLEDFWVSDAFIFLSNLFEKNDKFSIKEGERNLYICSRYIYNLDPILENIASIDCRIENFEALVNELNNLWKNNYTTISVLDYMNIGYLKLTDLYNRTGEPEQAESCAIEAKKISEILIREDPNDSYFFRNKYIIQLQTGDALFNSEKFSEALENYLTSLEQNKNLSKKYPDEVEFLLDFSVISDKIAHCYKIIGDNKKSNEYYNNILTVNEELYNKYPESLSITNALCMSYDRIGEINMSNGNYNNALNIYLKSVNIQNEIFKSNPTDIFLIGNIVINLNKIGMINRIQKNYDISFRHHERALNLIKTINPKDIFNPEQMLNFLMCYVFLSELYLDKKEYDKSLENISTAKALCIEYIDNFLESYNINAVLSKCMIIDAENNTAIGNYDKAVENYNASVKIDEKLIASTPENYGASKNLISKYKTFGDLLLGINRIDDALNIFERAQIIHLNLNKKFPENFYYYKTLTENCFKIGYCLYIKKEYEKANDWLGSFLGNFQNILDSGLAYDNSLLHSAQWAKQIVDNINYSISFEEKQKENNIKTNRDTALSVELSELEKLILDAEEYFFNSKWEIAEKLFLKLLSKNIVVDNIQYKLSICIINGNEKLSSENFNRVLNLISQLRVNGKLMEAAEIEKLLLKKK